MTPLFSSEPIPKDKTMLVKASEWQSLLDVRDAAEGVRMWLSTKSRYLSVDQEANIWQTLCRVVNACKVRR